MDLDKKRIVVKVGTSTITHEDGSINFRIIDRLCRVLSEIESLGYKTVLVSSGAIGVGVNKLRLTKKPAETRMKQAAAAVGQCGLMHIYDKCFGEDGRLVAQILFTGDDIEVEKIDEKVLSLAGGAGSARGTGGMISKLDAAGFAAERGIDTLIILGKEPEKIYDIILKESIRFRAKKQNRFFRKVKSALNVILSNCTKSRDFSCKLYGDCFLFIKLKI